MRRRDFIKGVAGSAAAWPLAARAQQTSGMKRVGVLVGGIDNDPTLRSFVAAFREGLAKLRWVEGRNISINDRWAAGDFTRMRTQAADLVATNPDVVLADNTLIVQELQRQTRTIPIVFVELADPVATGVVASLARPGGNTTGFMNPEASISGKWLELLKEIAPGIKQVLVMVNAGNAGNVNRLRAIEASAQSLGVRLSSSVIPSVDEIESAVDSVARKANAGLIVAPGNPLDDHRKLIITLAARYRLPAVYPVRSYVADGGLMSYGAEPIDMWRRAASYIDRILKGEKPANLPVQAPTKFELVINLKAAKTLGITLPATLLARADEVIE